VGTGERRPPDRELSRVFFEAPNEIEFRSSLSGGAQCLDRSAFVSATSLCAALVMRKQNRRVRPMMSNVDPGVLQRIALPLVGPSRGGRVNDRHRVPVGQPKTFYMGVASRRSVSHDRWWGDVGGAITEARFRCVPGCRSGARFRSECDLSGTGSDMCGATSQPPRNV